VITSVITSPLRQANAGRTDSLVALGRAIPQGHVARDEASATMDANGGSA
jgi:hypothetical protein